jgi:ABC-type glycerol-3-phosphate transport system permease component
MPERAYLTDNQLKDVEFNARSFQRRRCLRYASTRPDFPRFFLNSVIIPLCAVALSVAAGIPAAYALAGFVFPLKNALAFVFMSFRFVPFLAFFIPLCLLCRRVGLYNTQLG